MSEEFKVQNAKCKRRRIKIMNRGDAEKNVKKNTKK